MKEYALRLTEAEMNLILKALANLEYKEVANTINDVKEQIIKQNKEIPCIGKFVEITNVQKKGLM